MNDRIVNEMTRDEFIAFYCAGGGITWEELSKYREAVPCTCGDPSCRGWAMLPRTENSESATSHNQESVR